MGTNWNHSNVADILVSSPIRQRVIRRAFTNGSFLIGREAHCASEAKKVQSRYFYRHQNNYSLHQGAMCSSHIYHPVYFTFFFAFVTAKISQPSYGKFIACNFLPFPHRHQITASAFIFSLVGGNKIIANYRTKLPYYHTHILPYFTLVIIPILVHLTYCRLPAEHAVVVG